MANWSEIARRFAVLRPIQWIDPAAKNFLGDLGRDDKVVVACSGGADSVFLVLTAVSLLGEKRLHIAHYHHGLRGREADQDATFVEELAASLEIDFSMGKLEGSDNDSEAYMRKARYGWLLEVYRDIHAQAILLGHHADDLLENQIIALFSGSGPAGLCSPMPVRKFPDGHLRIRPLLPMKRSTIERTLISLGAPWREDSTNADTRYTRNWIRRELVPMLEDHFPQDIHAGSSRTRVLMQDANDALDEIIDNLQLDLSDERGFPVTALFHKGRGIIRRALLAWWMRHHSHQELPAAAADKVVATIQDGQLNCPVSIGAVARGDLELQCLVINDDGMIVLAPEKTAEFESWQAGCHWVIGAGPVYIPSGGYLCGEFINWKPEDAPYRDAKPAENAWLRQQSGPLHVRQWRAGDRYRPLGAPGTRKLQDIFSDAKLNSEQKQALPVILNSKGEILWVPGFPPAESAKVDDDSNSALRLTYRPLSTA